MSSSVNVPGNVSYASDRSQSETALEMMMIMQTKALDFLTRKEHDGDSASLISTMRYKAHHSRAFKHNTCTPN